MPNKFDDIEIIDMTDPGFLDIQIEDLEHYIVVFDDHENISDKELRKYIQHFQKDCLERTRKLQVDIIFINHQTQNYNITKGL